MTENVLSTVFTLFFFFFTVVPFNRRFASEAMLSTAKVGSRLIDNWSERISFSIQTLIIHLDSWPFLVDIRQVSVTLPPATSNPNVNMAISHRAWRRRTLKMVLNTALRRYIRPQIVGDRLQVISSHLVGSAHRYAGRIRRLRAGNPWIFSAENRLQCGQCGG